MQKFIIVILFSLFNTLLFSQELHVYKGQYIETDTDSISYKIFEREGQDWGSSSGNNETFDNTTYQYFENEANERIYNGFFRVNDKKQSLIINGQFLNNYKHGIWKITSKYDDKITLDTSAEYLNGKLNGKCFVKGIDLKTKKVFISSNATFKDNIMIGQYSYKEINNYLPYDVIDVNINFDNNGLYDGDFTVKYSVEKINYEDKSIYQNGILISSLVRNMNNGNIIYKYANNQIEINFNNNIGVNNYSYNEALSKALDYWNITWKITPYNGSYTNIGESPIYIIGRGIDIEGFNLNRKIIKKLDKTSEDL